MPLNSGGKEALRHERLHLRGRGDRTGRLLVRRSCVDFGAVRQRRKKPMTAVTNKKQIPDISRMRITGGILRTCPQSFFGSLKMT
jgi:hypothetical protein